MVTKRTICKLLIGCFCLSVGTVVLADEPDKPPMPKCGVFAPHERPDPAAIERHISERLQKLVDDQIITKEQSTKLLAFFKEKAAERKADMEKMKEMSPEERDAYLKEKFKHPDMVTELQNAGGLSSNQANAVDAALRPPHRPDGDMGKRLSACLDKLVSEKTLTKEQADKVTSFFKQKAEERKADMEKIKNMSPAEREAFLKEKMAQHPDLIKDLQAAAELTENQAKTVADALRPPHRPDHDRPEPPMP